MKNKKKILVAPLDWGIGHAVRCIPIINKLLENNFEVIIGGSGISGKLLLMEFPHLQYEEIPGYEVTYSKKIPMAFNMLRQVPSILQSIKQEKKWLNKYILKNSLNAVISDHRYGLYNKNIYSVFMAHQLFISSGNNKLFEPILWKINKSYINNFNCCWIPDINGEINASGNLSHKKEIPFNHFFIGLISRFSTPKITIEKNNTLPAYKYKIAFILSGIEPLRTELENLIIEQSFELPLGKYILVRGSNNHLKREIPTYLEIVNMANSKMIEDIIYSSELIVSRAGYSSIMDYLITSKKALLIPTPGQTEQEYLANYHLKCGNFYSVKQRNLNLNTDIKIAATYMPHFTNNTNLLEIALNELIKSLN